eukprot:2054603-Prymnesium_polylepis.1
MEAEEAAEEAVQRPATRTRTNIDFLQENGGAAPGGINFSEVLTIPRFDDDCDDDMTGSDNSQTEVCHGANEITVIFETEVLTFEEYRRRGITKCIFKNKARECMRTGAPVPITRRPTPAHGCVVCCCARCVPCVAAVQRPHACGTQAWFV